MPRTVRLARVTRAIRTTLSVVLATALVSSIFVTAAPVASALSGASLLVTKSASSGSKKLNELAPGDSVSYRVQFRVNDADADGPVQLIDQLPAGFAGWNITGLQVRLGGSTEGLTIDLPGVISGAANQPAGAGTIGSTEAERQIAVTVDRPTSSGGRGMTTLETGELTYIVEIPDTLSPLDAASNVAQTNTATFTAFDGTQPLQAESSRAITVVNPVKVDVTAAKTWNPGTQAYQPGVSSTVHLAVTQASNVPATQLTLQDPAVAEDGATELAATNPFTHVNFAGFATTPETLPAGATAVATEVYVQTGGSWSWVPWNAATIAAADVAGVRHSYTGEFAPGTVIEQDFAVVQRERHRSTADVLNTGYSRPNEVLATLSAPDQATVTDTATASITVSEERIALNATKAFYALPNGAETANLTGVTAGDSVGVVVRAQNRATPQSTTLDELVIREPASGSHEKYFGADLSFAGFADTDLAQFWPAGATGASITWFQGGTETVAYFDRSATTLPAAPSGVTGFEVSFTGAIAPTATTELRYRIATNGAESFVAAGETTPAMLNRIAVTGTKTDVKPVTVNAEAKLSVVAPKIIVSIDKQVGPGEVLIGEDVVVQLATTSQATGGRTKPTEILIEDSTAAFWNAFDAKALLAPLTRPENNGVAATLEVWGKQGADWVLIATNPDPATDLPLPAGITGVRIGYTNASGLSQTTNVTPVLQFTARSTLRDSGAPVATSFATPATVKNVATADAEGMLDTRVVTGDATDNATVLVRTLDPAENPDGLWIEKNWSTPRLVSQSGAEPTTTQKWVVAIGGYQSVTLQDPVNPTTTGAGTVFAAFDLTLIRPIRFDRAVAGSSYDPQLRWDTVTAVELFNGTTWNAVTAPAGGWMNATGFVGYTLTAAQQSSTLGVRLQIAENTVARQGSAANATTPKPGAGVASSAATRSYDLQWRLRETARPSNPHQWVTGTAAFNCAETATGCVTNTVSLTGHRDGRPDATDRDDADIIITDGVWNVALDKTVQAWPAPAGTTPGANVTLTVPTYGELEQADYPRARYTLTAKNSSGLPYLAPKLGKIRVADTFIEGPQDRSIDIGAFTGRDFVAETKQPGGNHFDEFTLTGVSFAGLPSSIDRNQSTVQLWLYDPTTQLTSVSDFTLQQAMSGDPAFVAALPSAVGIATTYQGTDPATRGNQILPNDALTMYLDVQLRATERVSGAPVAGGLGDAVVTVPNTALAIGWDAVVDPAKYGDDDAQANVNLKSAQIDVALSKTITVANGDTPVNATVYETAPGDLAAVRLRATPANSTAGLTLLTITDDDPAFWNRFELRTVGALTHPLDADSAEVQYRVADQWITASEFGGELGDVRGVRALFTRTTGTHVFPAGANSWDSSWGEAVLPFTVALRTDAEVTWTGDLQRNEADVLAETTIGEGAQATDDSAAIIDFSPGIHRIQVEKRAPSESSANHYVAAMASQQWQLRVSNVGTSYLPLLTVVDELPADLKWDGETPVITSSVGAEAVTTRDVITDLTADTGYLEMRWPDGTRLAPGESLTITLGLIMQPVGANTQVWNRVVADTGVALAACVQPTGGGQAPSPHSFAATDCSNRNYVKPMPGTVIGTVKTVSGEVADTLGENLVSGAYNPVTGGACMLGGFEPVGTDYTRYPCASFTAVGATDVWKLQQVNAGTEPIARMTIVDMLPTVGDRMLAGGGSRGSTFRPVLANFDSIELSNLPAGAVTTIEVTRDTAACVGSGPSSQWIADPECVDTVANPHNTWESLEAFAASGASSELVAGIRVRISMPTTPLAPGASIGLTFETVNRVVQTAEHGLVPNLSQFATTQFAWNQNGVVAWNTSGERVDLPAAPTRAGVTPQTGELQLRKRIDAGTQVQADAVYPVELSCDVPSGDGDARVPFDLGESAVVLLPGSGKAVSVRGIPVGANCTAQESGEVGAFGESARSIVANEWVTPNEAGTSAVVRIRNPQVPVAFELQPRVSTELVNSYADPEPAPKPTPEGGSTGPDGGQNPDGSADPQGDAAGADGLERTGGVESRGVLLTLSALLVGGAVLLLAGVHRRRGETAK